MTNTAHDLARQVAANMSDEMKACFLGASTEDQIGLAAEMALESLKKNLRMEVAFNTDPKFKSAVQDAALQILTA